MNRLERKLNSKKDFEKLLTERPEIKEQMYKQICDAYILGYKRASESPNTDSTEFDDTSTKSNYREILNNLSESSVGDVNDKVMIVDGLNMFIRCFGASSNSE